MPQTKQQVLKNAINRSASRSAKVPISGVVSQPSKTPMTPAPRPTGLSVAPSQGAKTPRQTEFPATVAPNRTLGGGVQRGIPLPSRGEMNQPKRETEFMPRMETSFPAQKAKPYFLKGSART